MSGTTASSPTQPWITMPFLPTGPQTHGKWARLGRNASHWDMAGEIWLETLVPRTKLNRSVLLHRPMLVSYVRIIFHLIFYQCYPYIPQKISFLILYHKVSVNIYLNSQHSRSSHTYLIHILLLFLTNRTLRVSYSLVNRLKFRPLSSMFTFTDAERVMLAIISFHCSQPLLTISVPSTNFYTSLLPFTVFLTNHH